MIEKAPAEDPHQIVVTFTHPVQPGTTSVCVAGDFNDWSTHAQPMAIVDETAVCTMALAAGRTHRFRYLVDGERWENDWAADAYTPNDYGGDDSVVDLSEVPAAPAKAAKKPAAAAKKATKAAKAAKAPKAPKPEAGAATPRKRATKAKDAPPAD
jgi:1,4-alpha-glucan branching enzyme